MKIKKAVSDKVAAKLVVTACEVFPDGSAIELVSDLSGNGQPRLLFWNKHKAVIAPQVKLGGVRYQSIKVAASLCQATRLPSHVQVYGSAGDLFTSIAGLFSNCSHLADREARLLACFCLGTWLADRLPMAPSLAIFCPDHGEGINLLRVLHCLCRRPLMLAEVTRGGLHSLTPDFITTLLIGAGNLTANLADLLRTTNYRGLHVLGSRGTVVDLYRPSAILCAPEANGNLGDGVIQISLSPMLQSPELDEQRLKEIADRFQSRLLLYRLQNCSKIRELQVDVSQFTTATRRLAHALAACFPGDPDLAREVIVLLGPQDHEVRAQRFLDPNYIIAEILLGEIHKGQRTKVKIEDLAKDVTALVRSRGELKDYSAEEIGWKLKRLSIPKQTDSSGRHIGLDRDTSRRLHILARAYELPSSKTCDTVCPECVVSEAPAAKPSEGHGGHGGF